MGQGKRSSPDISAQLMHLEMLGMFTGLILAVREAEVCYRVLFASSSAFCLAWRRFWLTQRMRRRKRKNGSGARSGGSKDGRRARPG